MKQSADEWTFSRYNFTKFSHFSTCIPAPSLTWIDPPETVETVWVGLRISWRQDGTAAFCQIATAGNWNDNVKNVFVDKVY